MKRLSLVASIALTACRLSPSPDAVRHELLEADRAFNAAVQHRRIDAWVEAFATDGAQFRLAGAVRGHDAIREFMGAAFRDTAFRLTWEPDGAGVSDDGALGYTIGHSEARGRDSTAKPFVREGRYLTVWRRQPDGTWKVEADIGFQGSATYVEDDPVAETRRGQP
jgi:ketosteroid isomerase-like protein